MGLFDSIGSYIDARKRVAARNLRDVAADPGGMFGTWGNQVREDLTSNMQQMGAGVTDRGLLSQSIAAAMGPAGNAPMGLLGHTVYHGSPHKFDKFDASKIGTGEGAQAYGHGLYLAESPVVAKEYQDALKWRGSNWDDPQIAAANVLEGRIAKGDRVKAAEELEKARAAQLRVWPNRQNKPLDDAIALLRSDAPITGKSANPGALYKVDLPDEWLPKMLDWDRPLSQQPSGFDSAMQSIGFKPAPWPYSGYMGTADKTMVNGGAGEDVWRAIVKQAGSPEAAANAMRSAGIPGIRYLDGGSRSAGDGTYNYVVFPGMEGLLKILERQ